MRITPEILKTLPTGTFVFVANHNSFRYKYIGVHFCDTDNTEKHVFLSDHFVSTIAITKGREDKSIYRNILFDTKEEAIIESTLLKYGVDACRTAFEMHTKGAGGSTVGIEFGSVTMSDPELRGLGDRLIDAGQWLHENI